MFSPPPNFGGGPQQEEQGLYRQPLQQMLAGPGMPPELIQMLLSAYSGQGQQQVGPSAGGYDTINSALHELLKRRMARMRGSMGEQLPEMGDMMSMFSGMDMQSEGSLPPGFAYGDMGGYGTQLPGSLMQMLQGGF